MIGPDIDIPAPDMGTNAKVMAWIMNQYQKYHGFSPACVTGKPVELYGVPGREEATGRGVGIFAVKLLSRLGRKPAQTRVALQGFGNVGSHAAKFLREADFKLVAISDVSGGYYRRRGAQRQSDAALRPRTSRSLAGYTTPRRSRTKHCWNWTSSCWCRRRWAGVITAENAPRIKAPIIIEAANGPIWPDADRFWPSAAPWSCPTFWPTPAE